MDLYLLHDAYSKYQLESAANVTDFDVAKSLSSVEPSLFWLAVQVVATGIGGAAQCARSGRSSAPGPRSGQRVPRRTGLVNQGVGLRTQQAGVSAASRERAIAESMPTTMTADEIVESAAEAGIRCPTTPRQPRPKPTPGPGQVSSHDRPMRRWRGPAWGAPDRSGGTGRCRWIGFSRPPTPWARGTWRFPELADGEVLDLPVGVPGVEAARHRGHRRGGSCRHERVAAAIDDQR